MHRVRFSPIPSVRVFDSSALPDARRALHASLWQELAGELQTQQGLKKRETQLLHGRNATEEKLSDARMRLSEARKQLKVFESKRDQLATQHREAMILLDGSRRRLAEARSTGSAGGSQNASDLFVGGYMRMPSAVTAARFSELETSVAECERRLRGIEAEQRINHRDIASVENHADASEVVSHLHKLQQIKAELDTNRDALKAVEDDIVRLERRLESFY